MGKLKVGSLFQQSWVGVVNPMKFEVLELDRNRNYLRVKCIGKNGCSHEEIWQGPGDGVEFTEEAIVNGEYKIIKN